MWRGRAGQVTSGPSASGPFEVLGALLSVAIPDRVPGPARRARLSSVSNGSLALEWEAPAEGRASYYVVQTCAAGAGGTCSVFDGAAAVNKTQGRRFTATRALVDSHAGGVLAAGEAYNATVFSCNLFDADGSGLIVGSARPPARRPAARGGSWRGAVWVQVRGLQPERDLCAHAGAAGAAAGARVRPPGDAGGRADGAPGVDAPGRGGRRHARRPLPASSSAPPAPPWSTSARPPASSPAGAPPRAPARLRPPRPPRPLRACAPPPPWRACATFPPPARLSTARARARARAQGVYGLSQRRAGAVPGALALPLARGRRLRAQLCP